MDVKIKTFRIQSPADEQTLNEFLSGKIVRHWGTEYEPSGETGTWNLILAYEVRVNEVRHASEHTRDHNGREHGRDRDHGRREQGSHAPASFAPKPVREKPPREDYQPQIAAGDQPLFEAIRKWRNARAREERVKPFALFNNKQLELIVNAKPASTDTLHPLVPDMEKPLWDKYQNELVGFIEAATSVNGHSPETVQEAPAVA